jgi:hypothetical protein
MYLERGTLSVAERTDYGTGTSEVSAHGIVLEQPTTL